MAVEREPGQIELFVPGRICLFGEHSDWAASYRRINSAIEKGYTIICGTNQGLYARVRTCESAVRFRRVDEDGTESFIELPLDKQKLLAVAEEGGFWSYVAGVAYQVLTHYHVGGVEIDNYRTDLPLKKGLSSSAAVCVLVTRAFNRLYDLRMTTRGEMDMAYRGEITTPSRCGRMDQGCAYGSRPILMTFDSDAIDVRELRVGSDLHYVIVDLNAGKDTVKILGDLNKAYPFADSPPEEQVQKYLGPTNKALVKQAMDALESGNPPKLGELMDQAQASFDAAMIPASPVELTAPTLHRLLSDETIRSLVAGGKGVGSQGDGTAQLLARDEEAQRRTIDILKKDFGMTAYPLTVARSRTIRKAVITAAGFGTRLFPFTKVVRKEFMPVVDDSGLAKPLIMKHVEELVDAGIERVAIVIQRREQPVFERLFNERLSNEVFNRLSPEAREAENRLNELGRHVEYIHQDEQGGLGDAALVGGVWAGKEPFLLVLGDHVFTGEDGKESCVRQLLATHDELNAPVLGLARTPSTEVHKFGCVAGTWEADGELLNIEAIVEKPSSEYASEHLSVPGLPQHEYLSVFGLYIVDERLVGILRRMKQGRSDGGTELQLTDALEQFREAYGLRGKVIAGRKEDIGTPG